jgi:hypothetical protein
MKWKNGEELNIQRPTFNIQRRTKDNQAEHSAKIETSNVKSMIDRIPYWKLSVERSMLDVNLLFNRP